LATTDVDYTGCD